MKYTIVSGSQRQNSNSLKVATIVEQYLQSQPSTAATYLLSLEEKPLPLWDDSLADPQSTLAQKWAPIAQEFAASSAFVIVVPEWHGMVPAALKNLFLFCGNQLLAHKPALIVAISSGMGGSYPVNELRTSSYKNTRLCYTPDHLIIRNVGDFLAGYDKPASPVVQTLKLRLHYSLEVLTLYAQAFQSIRQSPLINLHDFPNGL